MYKPYFYITVHFFPEYEGTVLTKIDDNLYKSIETGELYRKRLLYDFGWGQENGFELLPPLSFHHLINLIEQPIDLTPKKSWRKYTEDQIRQTDIRRGNLYGAVAVIMQDHVKELIDFLFNKINTDYFSNPGICENFKAFTVDSKRARAEGKFPGGVLTQSYEEVLCKYPEWRKIAARVTDRIYGSCDI